MSWIVSWNDVDYDIDPNEFTTGELKQIKILTNLSFKQLISAVGDLDAEALLVLFWTVEKRGDANLKFSDYQGPPMKVIISALAGFMGAVDDLGKATAGLPSPTPTTQTDGSPSSPSTVDIPELSTTL